MWYVPSDTYNVERIDFSLGSNSLMFGDSAPGGQATSYTKRPQFRTFAEVFASASSFGTSRVQLDVNSSYKKIVAVRFNAVNRNDSSYIHHTYQRQKAEDLSLLFRPTPTTTIILEGETRQQVRRRGENAVGILDVAAAGLALNQNNRWYYTSDGRVYQRPPVAPATIPPATPRRPAQYRSLLSVSPRTCFCPAACGKTTSATAATSMSSGRSITSTVPTTSSRHHRSIDRQLQLEFSYNQQFQHQQRNDNSFGTTQSPP